MLDELDKFKICTGYRISSTEDSGEKHSTSGRMPATIREFGEWKALYENVDGWKCDSSKFITFGAVPDNL